MLNWPPNSPALNSIEHLWGVLEKKSPIHGGTTLQNTGHDGSAANVLVSDTTIHLQRYSGVHVLMGQSCFITTNGTYTILVNWFYCYG